MNTAATKALKEYQEKVRNGEIEKSVSKTPIQKWEDNKTSLRLSVNAMCHQCMGGGKTEFRTDIKNCTATSCALYEVRPYK